MVFARPSLDELVERVTAEVQSRLGLGPPLPRSYLGVLSRVLAGLAHGIHGHVEWGAEQVVPATADAEFLERHADFQGLDPVRRPASSAVGVARFTGTNGSTIPQGTLVQRSDGTKYSTDAAAVIASGIADIALTATTAGVIGNAPAATVLSLSTPVAGVDATATVDANALTGGQDIETDEQLRTRLRSFMRARPQGGSIADYEAWTLEVAGVTRVFVLPLNSGLGTVDVTFLVDDDPTGPIPSAAQVQAVQDRLTDPTRRDSAPVGVTVTAFAPLTEDADFVVSVLPNTAEVQANVEAALEDLVIREAEPGGTIELSKIREAISTAAGEDSHTLVSPVGDLVASAGAIFVFGTVTFS